MAYNTYISYSMGKSYIRTKRHHFIKLGALGFKLGVFLKKGHPLRPLLISFPLMFELKQLDDF